MIKLKQLLFEDITGKLDDETEKKILKNFSSGEKILKKLRKLPEISRGKYVGDCKAHKCDMNSMKKARAEKFELYHGLLLTFKNKKFDTLAEHTFNVKDGKVYEFTELDGGRLTFNNSRYFGIRVDRKDWKGYQYGRMKKYSI